MRVSISLTNAIHCAKMQCLSPMTQNGASWALCQEERKNQKAEEEFKKHLSNMWAFEQFFKQGPIEYSKEPRLDKHRREFWSRYAVHPRETNSLALSELKGSFKGRAVDLGCGNGNFSLDAIKREWEVVAVDSSLVALNTLKKRIEEESLPSEQKAKVSTVHQKIEDFTFLNSLHLVYANDSLSYIPPKHVKAVLKRIHDALEKDGVFVGNFFICPQNKETENRFRGEGMWFVDKPMAQALLNDFVIKQLSIKDWWKPVGANIEFVASKSK